MFWKFTLIGFLAQFVDGALGMAYGVISTTFLLSSGIPPSAASASVHAAKVFTAVTSGLSHLFFGNVDRQLLKRLVVTGVVGAVGGAVAVSYLPSAEVKLVVTGYLGTMGIFILLKGANRELVHHRRVERAEILGACGGFLDAAGGGGWGPIVTSTLLGQGHLPRFAIGTVSLAEFFISFSALMTFVATIGIGHWKIILGLITGGIAAAPLAAYFCRKLPPRALMLIVGVLILVLCGRTLMVTLR